MFSCKVFFFFASRSPCFSSASIVSAFSFSSSAERASVVVNSLKTVSTLTSAADLRPLRCLNFFHLLGPLSFVLFFLRASLSKLEEEVAETAEVLFLAGGWTANWLANPCASSLVLKKKSVQRQGRYNLVSVACGLVSLAVNGLENDLRVAGSKSKASCLVTAGSTLKL